MSEESAAELPQIVDAIREIVRKVDAIELVAKLQFLRQWSAPNDMPKRDEIAATQVGLEFLSWIASTQREWAGEPEEIDGGVTNAVLELADKYFEKLQLAEFWCPRSDNLNERDLSLRNALISEQRAVRGEGHWNVLQNYSRELYQSNSSWMETELGFNVNQAIKIVNAIVDLITDRWNGRTNKIAAEAREAIRHLRNLKRRKQERLTTDEKRILIEVEHRGITATIRNAATFDLYADCKSVIQITAQDISSQSKGSVSEDTAEKFLNFASSSFGAETRMPDPIGLCPLYEKPIWFHSGNYYVPLAGILSEFVLNAPHYAMIADTKYRAEYDRVRGDWLEAAALKEIERLLPGCTIFANLRYGPTNPPFELDGLVIYDNKLVFVEAKSKQLTLRARHGDVEAAKNDLQLSIVAAYKQAKRAIDHVHCHDVAEFRTADGELIEIRKDRFNATYVLCVTGKGSALGSLPARISHYVEPGTFERHSFPSAIPLMDLRIFAEILESPAQFFDYLDRRIAAVHDTRFYFHDEWDLFGAYLKGHLDPVDPQYRNSNWIALTGMDDELDTYFRAKDISADASIDKPRRVVPDRIRPILASIESLNQPGVLDLSLALLRFPNKVLDSFADQMQQLFADVRATGLPKSTHLFMKDTECGITCLAGIGPMPRLSQLLEYR
ncbi:NERD domain-containing protein [candidate division KSB1 bacterium]|nr:NERD domain-containing protein [candidate division KSB1 bacterium]